MSLTVTLNVFSGRPNPTWVIPDEGASEFNERISQIRTTSNLKPAGVMGGLGYRGFTVRRNEETHAFHVHAGIVDTGLLSPTLVADDRDIERWLLSTVTTPLPELVAAHIEEALREPIRHDALTAAVLGRTLSRMRFGRRSGVQPGGSGMSPQCSLTTTATTMPTTGSPTPLRNPGVRRAISTRS